MSPNNETDCIEKMNLKKRPIDIDHHYDYISYISNVIFIFMINGCAQIIRSAK